MLEEWFIAHIGTPTDLQLRTWSSIKEGKHTMVISPTGSGKTLSAVIPAVDFILSGKADRSRTTLLYVTPMKALGADLVRAFLELSKGLGRLPGKLERPPPRRGRRGSQMRLENAPLQVGIRTGDVPQSERRRISIDPPDILVITPENLLLMLCSKAREVLCGTAFVVVDEVHEMVPSKRGALLSLSLEYLEFLVRRNGKPAPVRIGLSATIEEDRIAAGYLGGSGDDRRKRPVEVVREDSKKAMDIEFRTLFSDLAAEPDVEEGLLLEIAGIVKDGKGPIVVFHNTRRKAEEMAFALTSRGYEGIMPHHGSLGPEIRKEAEDGLKQGRLKAIISSTSLELGVDIGCVDTVCQISSPKSPVKMLQRFGRSGHGLGRTSHGILLPTNPVDLLESLAVTISAGKGQMEGLKASDRPMDMLAQFLIGLTILEHDITEEGIFRLARKAYAYRELKLSDVRSLLSLLSERLPGRNQPAPRLRRDIETGAYLPRRDTRQAFYLNCGAIPKETSYKVFDQGTRKVIGDLSRDFGEALYERDAILLGSKVYRIKGFSGTTILASEDPDANPTIPTWSGEVNPRPSIVAETIYQLHRNGCSGFDGLLSIGKSIALDANGSKVCSGLLEGLRAAGIVIAPVSIPVERVQMEKGRTAHIFHVPLGRRTTDILGRVISYGIRKRIGASVDYLASDDGFALSSPLVLSEDDLLGALSLDDFKSLARELTLTSSVFRLRFAHCLNKSLLVLTRFRGRETGVLYRRSAVERLLSTAMEAYYDKRSSGKRDLPTKGLLLLMEEALGEVLSERAELERAQEIARDISRKRTTLVFLDVAKQASILGQQMVRNWIGSSQKRSNKTSAMKPMLSVLPLEGANIKGLPPAPDTQEGLRALLIDALSGKESSLCSVEALRKDHSGSSGDFDDTLTALIADGSISRLTLGGSDLAIPVHKMGAASFLEDSRTVAQGRLERLTGEGGLRSVLKNLPFFSHPVEVLVRAHGTDLNDLRSAVKARRMVPVFTCGEERTAEQNQARKFYLLSPSFAHTGEGLMRLLSSGAPIGRRDLQRLPELSGLDMDQVLASLRACNLLMHYPLESREDLGAPEGLFSPIAGLDQFEKPPLEQKEAMLDFLERAGPFELSELAQIFNWHSGPLPEGFILALSSPDLGIGVGPMGPMSMRYGGSGLEKGIWVWSERGKGPNRQVMPSRTKPVQQHVEALFTSSVKDAAFVLMGKRREHGEREGAFGSSTEIFRTVEGPREISTLKIIENLDIIRVSELDILDYSKLDAASGEALKALEAYRRLSFEVFVIERIMGVPAGQAAKASVSRFLSSGFIMAGSARGEVLVMGAEAIDAVPREEQLEAMFRTQGLLPDSHKRHPLEVIQAIGGINDRWELLSRLGSSRYLKPKPLEGTNLKSAVEWHGAKFVGSVRTNGQIDLTDWDSMLTSQSEPLPSMKDLAKRFSLWRGMMEQESPVWGLMADLTMFPSPPRSSLQFLGNEEREVLEKARTLRPEDLLRFVRTQEKEAAVEELVRSGHLMEDPWGMLRFSRNRQDGSNATSNASEDVPRGVLQRAWFLRCANALGIFTLNDMRAYAPNLEDAPKLRAIANDLSRTHLKRKVCIDQGSQVIYSIPGIDPGSAPESETNDGDEGLIVISPKDRLSRVISRDVHMSLARGQGFAVFRKGRPLATISIKRSPRKEAEEGGYGGAQGYQSGENYTLKKAWIDLRYSRSKLIREIKKAFQSLGIRLLSNEEEVEIEDLYRDMEANERGS